MDWNNDFLSLTFSALTLIVLGGGEGLQIEPFDAKITEKVRFSQYTHEKYLKLQFKILKQKKLANW